MKLTNYHTHTSRCLHASGTDREYVEQAIQEGFSVLGFSDHSPWPYRTIPFVSNIRMDELELPGYVASIHELKQKYKDEITIRLGLECEAFPQYFSWIQEQVQKYEIDYLILGNHFSGNELHGLYYGNATNHHELYDYVKYLEIAVKSGLFYYIAHPDIIFSNYPVFDSYCEDVSKAICDLAISYKLPLEYNLSGIWKKNAGEFRGLGYPCQQFWEISKSYQPQVIVGLDAHAPKRINGTFFKEEREKLLVQGFDVIV